MRIAQLPYDRNMRKLDTGTHCFPDGAIVPFQRVATTPARLTWQSRPGEEGQRHVCNRLPAYGCTPTSQMDFVLFGAKEVANPAVLEIAIHGKWMAIRWECASTGRASRTTIETGETFDFVLDNPPYTRRNQTLQIRKIYGRVGRLSVELRHRGRPFDMTLVQFLTFAKMVEEQYFLDGSDTYLLDVRGHEVDKLGYPLIALKGWRAVRVWLRTVFPALRACQARAAERVYAPDSEHVRKRQRAEEWDALARAEAGVGP